MRITRSLFVATLALIAPLTAQRVVQTAGVTRGPLEVETLLQAEVRPIEQALVVPRVTGIARVVNVEVGDRVSKGAVLCEIDAPELAAKRKVAAAELSACQNDVVVAEAGERAARVNGTAAEEMRRAAQTVLEAARTARELAAKIVARKRDLHEAGAVTADELDRAETAMLETESRLVAANVAAVHAAAELQRCRAQIESAAASLGAARANGERAAAMLDEADVFVGFAKVRAPFEDTLVTRRLLDPGAHLLADETVVFELMNTARVRVRFMIPADSARGLTTDASVRIVRPGAAGDVTTRVTRLAGAVDQISRTMVAEVEIDNDGSWIPGSLCQVQLVTASVPDALTVPDSALVQHRAAQAVWVVEHGKVRRVAVKTGVDLGRTVQIVSGLDGDEEVIVSGASGLRDGVAVVARRQDG